MEAAGVQPTDIDLVIVATSTPDMVFPSTACIVQRKLGIQQGAAFDLQAVCAGFIYALSVADSMIRSGTARRALVIGAEVFSRILDFSDRTTCVLFGDGAGAVVLEASDEPGILATRLHADGRHAEVLCTPGHVSGGQVIGRPCCTWMARRCSSWPCMRWTMSPARCWRPRVARPPTWTGWCRTRPTSASCRARPAS
jgi:3-oxoacyl-[acyl-carrier-protein] synthase-3